EAIESVRMQRNVRWELVIVLDAASAQAAQVAHAEAIRAPGQIIIVGAAGGAPGGLSAARNLGIAQSRAAAVAFLDADDVLEPDALARRLAALDAHPDTAMVYGSTLYWHSWTGSTADRGRDFVPDLGVVPRRVYPAPTLVPPLLDGSAAVPCTCSLLVRRWALEACGGFDPEFRDLYEDQVFYARIALRFPVVAEDWILDRYRQHRDSMSARADSARQREARANFLDWLEREIESIGVRDESLARTLVREQWKVQHPRL